MATKRGSFIPHSPAKFRVGIEATGSMHWFLKLLEDLEIDCQVGHPSKVRAAEPRKQKHDRRDAALLLKLQGRKPLSIDLPTFDRAARSAHVADAPPLTQSPMPAKVDDSC